MSTDHYAEAVSSIDNGNNTSLTDPACAYYIQRAQVHATLAVVDAIHDAIAILKPSPTWVGPSETVVPSQKLLDEIDAHTPTSPDCHQGKHATCVGDAWDDHTDEPAECRCECHEVAA